MSATSLSLIRRNLLRWYDKARRDLPWRHTRDPYAIWIAETMLQQTQVATVAPYYERFLRAFPTVRALDRAPLRKVLALWSGLGYYRRAENLKKSAREVVLKHGGRVPSNYDTLLSLPGVGDYTAGALMSIAFQEPYPALDGNARRVLGRLFDVSNEAELRKAAQRLMPNSRPGYFNQGLMELGATICIPKMPHCPECPVASKCAARAAGRRFERPTVRKDRIVKDVIWPLAIVRRDGKILLRRRPAGGILAGLWELPGGEKKKNESPRFSLHRHLQAFHGALKRDLCIGELRHSITTRIIRSPIFLIDVRLAARIRLPGSHWRWLTPSSLFRYPVSSMTSKAVKILSAHEKSFL